MGKGIDGKSLWFLLNFAVNPKLPLKIKSIKKIIIIKSIFTIKLRRIMGDTRNHHDSLLRKRKQFIKN